MHRDPATPKGDIHQLTLNSKLLENNLLGDPTARRIDVYIPHGSNGQGLPLLVDIVGYTAGGPAHTNWKNFGENTPERLDRLIASGDMPPCVVAFPDCFTKLGGNQYINSSAVGPWDDILRTEMVPLVEQTYTCGGEGKRAIFGKSSGGYGAMVHALLHPGFWAAAASHSGDMGFELLFKSEFPRLLRKLAKVDFDIGKWIDDFHAAKKLNGDDLHDLMTLAMCATYDPDPSQPYGVRLPVTTDTCELIPERWAAWEKWDPINLLADRAEDLRRLKALYFDCGDVDQYNIVYGARRFHKALDARNIPHTYEEFPDNHSSVDYRMDVSLPLLAKALSTSEVESPR